MSVDTGSEVRWYYCNTGIRAHGKALTGNLKGIWRYRVGDYRIFAEFEDDELIVLIFEVAHRREVYKR